MIKFRVTKPDGSVNMVRLMQHKSNSKWSFVNMTKGHICPFEFDSIEDALDDLQEHRRSGKVVDFEMVENGEEYVNIYLTAESKYVTGRYSYGSPESAEDNAVLPAPNCISKAVAKVRLNRK